jgi:hypothetical protein
MDIVQVHRATILPLAILSTADMRRSMTKTTTIIAMIALLTLGTAFTARAQTSSTTPETDIFVSVSAGGQFQSRTFATSTTFSLFGDTGTVTANQTVGSGFVFDASGGYRVWRRLSVALGVSTFRGSGGAEAVVAVPNPLFFGKPTTKTFSASDYGNLSQTGTALNIQAVWIKPLTDKVDLWLFAGPSIIHVSQQIASATETQAATATIKSESANTGKAGTIGIDLNYQLNDRYRVGGFVRYAGGEVDLPSAAKLKIGGVQAGGGIRFKF